MAACSSPIAPNTMTIPDARTTAMLVFGIDAEEPEVARACGSVVASVWCAA
jgi:hypothetical protein